MLKLYKRDNDRTYYWETWDKNENTGVVHWGTVGQRGQDKEIKSGLFINFKKQIQKLIRRYYEDGYGEVNIEDHYKLLIEFKVEGFGTSDDLEKRRRLQSRMDDTLGWTGLGHCDGGSVGGGTMEVCCYVIDFEIAEKVIEQDLKDTEFSNYLRIFDENAE